MPKRKSQHDLNTMFKKFRIEDNFDTMSLYDLKINYNKIIQQINILNKCKIKIECLLQLYY